MAQRYADVAHKFYRRLRRVAGADGRALERFASCGERSRQVAEAVRRAQVGSFSHDELALMARVEALRAEMAVSEEALDSWDRPWLRESAELRYRMGLVDAADERFIASMTVREACASSKPERWCRLLFAIVAATKPLSVVEMGTNVGISGLYLAAALEMNSAGKLVTLEGARAKIELARRNVERADLAHRVQLFSGDFNEQLVPVLAAAAPVDLVFIDGFHDGDATVRYHGLCKQHATSDAVFIYDDIRWSAGMTRAWGAVSVDPDIEAALDLGGVGVCVLSSGNRDGQVPGFSVRY